MRFKELERIIKKDGWYLDSSNGSHMHYKHREKRESHDTESSRRPRPENCQICLADDGLKIKPVSKRRLLYEPRISRRILSL